MVPGMGVGGGKKGEGPWATEHHSPATEYYEIQPGCSSRARAGAWVWAGGRGWRGGGGVIITDILHSVVENGSK